MGGLFLAFPAIFCASATLSEKHERQRKTLRGLKGERRGTDAAALDASGAALGAVGMMAFGCSLASPAQAAASGLIRRMTGTRHCERKQPTSARGAKWIALSQEVLAMTWKQLNFMGHISNQALGIRG
jgi:hypothetical protein